MSVKSFYEWCASTGLSQALQNSQYAFPVIEVLHLFGLTLLLGSVFVLNLRFFGLGLTAMSVSELSKSLRAWLWAGFALSFLTGLLLFVAEAFPKLYENEAWNPKLFCVAAGMALLLTWQKHLTKPGHAEAKPWQARIAATLSLIFWLGAGIAGRAIGFL